MIWQGTLGELPITACFYDQENGSNEGVYYYQEHLRPLRLVELDEQAPNVVSEVLGRDQPNGFKWTIISKTKDSLSAVWSSEAAQYPIELTAFAVEYREYGTPCESKDFFEPLIAGGSTVESRAALEGTAYTKLEYTGPDRLGEDSYLATSFALDPSEPGDAAINRALTEILPDRSDENPMGECLGMSLPSGQLGYWTETLAPALIAAQWLTVDRSGSAYCAGAHPSHFWDLKVFDRQTGKAAYTPA